MDQERGLLIRDGSVELPIFFPSVSSVKTNLPPIDYLQLLVALREPQFLISAYDFVPLNPAAREALEAARTNGSIVLMDSGNYEAYWKGDKEWAPQCLHELLATDAYDMAFHFDLQDPPRSATGTIKAVLAGLDRDREAAGARTVVPIVHASPDHFVRVVVEVVRQAAPTMVAVPERLLGNGLLARVRSVAEIRRQLNDCGAATPLHLLGTGNPLSLLAFSLAGADSFDGLEWCQTTVDPDTSLLHHFQQRELFQNQLVVDASLDMDYLHQTLIHNLLFYRDWMSRIRAARKAADGMAEMVKEYFPAPFGARLIEEVEAVWGS